MDIFAVCSQKGGSGKTTTAINLSSALAINKKSVLLIDFDPQSHATMGLNIESKLSIYDVLSKISKNKCEIKDIVVEVENNFFMAPSSIMLSTIEQEFSDEIGRESRLLDALSQEIERHVFDYIVIDCPPNLGLLTINALRAANAAIIPVEASRFSFEGVAQVIEIINLVSERLNHPISYRVLVTIFDSRLRHSFQMLKRIKDTFKEKVYSTFVHINVKIKESQAAGTSVFKYDKYSRGAKDYFTLSKEIITGDQIIMEKISQKMKEVTTKKIKELQEIAFSFNAPTALSVFVVGDFNDWTVSDNHLLEKKDGVWSKRLKLKQGVYQYRFVVDGQWIEDPINPQLVTNPFGEFNSVINIK
jgi:chromosome partitioning protein